MPSAQNGQEMRYYQNGLDWKPKGMRNGGWLDGYDKAQDGTWLGNKLTPEGWITSTTKGGNRISFTGNQRADEWINKQIDSGKFGFNPKTGGTFPLKKPVKGLSKEDQFIGSEEYYNLRAPEGFADESQLAQIKNLPEWQQDIVNAENEKRRKSYVNSSMQEAYEHPLMSPGYFTPEGAAIGAIESAFKVGPDLYKGNYGSAAINTIGALPAVAAFGPELRSIKTSISPELRQGLQTNGFLDMFKSKPKSEINWGKWNSEIPDNPQLMKEYNAIEQTTKANGSWMKNPDGSTFQGTPEQFVQQNSENFKKYVENAKGNYNELLKKPFSYHGSSNNNITEFHTPQHSDYIKATGDTPETGIFLTNEKSLADIYATKNKKGKVYELYAPANYARPSLRNPNNIIETSVGTNIEKPILTGNLDLKDVEYLKSLDYTGIADHYLPNSSLEKVVFDSNIIKSATGNNGMFDMTNPNIYKSILPFVGYTGAGALTYKALQGQEEPLPGMRQGGIIKDDRGQWDHPGEITEINSNDITMQGVPYPVLGISDTGDTKLMQPGGKYKYKGKKVTEFPMAKNGLRQEQKGLRNLDDLTNFTNYNKSTGWLSKYE
jgi:hypothetical protein